MPPAPPFEFGTLFNIPSRDDGTYKNNEDYRAVLVTNPNVGAIDLSLRPGATYPFDLGDDAVLEMGADTGFDFDLRDHYTGRTFGNEPAAAVEPYLPGPFEHLALPLGYGQQWGYAMRFVSGSKNTVPHTGFDLDTLLLTCGSYQQDYQQPKRIQLGRVYDGVLLGYDAAAHQGDALEFLTPNFKTTVADQVGHGPKDLAVAVWGYQNTTWAGDTLAVYMHCEDDPPNQYRYASKGGHQQFILIPSTDTCSAYDIFVEDTGYSKIAYSEAGMNLWASAPATTFKLLVTRPDPAHVIDIDLDTDFEADGVAREQIERTAIDAARLWFTLNQGQGFIGEIHSFDTGKCNCGSKCNIVSVCFHDAKADAGANDSPVAIEIEGKPWPHCSMVPGIYGGVVHLYREGSDDLGCDAGSWCAHTLAHELGHCADGLLDEYSYADFKPLCGHTWMSDQYQKLPVFCTNLNHGRDGDRAPPSDFVDLDFSTIWTTIASIGNIIWQLIAYNPLSSEQAFWDGFFPRYSGAHNLYSRGLNANTVLNATPMTLDFTQPNAPVGMNANNDGSFDFSYSLDGTGRIPLVHVVEEEP